MFFSWSWRSSLQPCHQSGYFGAAMKLQPGYTAEQESLHLLCKVAAPPKDQPLATRPLPRHLTPAVLVVDWVQRNYLLFSVGLYYCRNPRRDQTKTPEC
ncbi:hypothetical protein V6N13_010976 [Hibiscus sabdariffa]|uniref:Uncharacterized protein n=1 Tax=Hibiscus sabdariffa TaxID=183260 RepID=A0ABR2SAT5_9ROSI